MFKTTLGADNAFQIPKITTQDQPASYPRRLFLHAPHTVNLASEKSSFARGLLQSYLNRAGDILQYAPGTKIGVIIHPGRGKGTTLEHIIDQMHSLTIPDGVTLYAENAASQGHEHCYSIEQLQELFETLPKKIKLCIDTQHSFASGICEWDSFETVSDFITEIDRVLPYRLRLFHLNDSKTTFKSRVDRHENIFEGNIWRDEDKREGLLSLLEISEHNKIPLILETPQSQKDLKVLFDFWEVNHGGKDN